MDFSIFLQKGGAYFQGENEYRYKIYEWYRHNISQAIGPALRISDHEPINAWSTKQDSINGFFLFLYIEEQHILKVGMYIERKFMSSVGTKFLSQQEQPFEFWTTNPDTEAWSAKQEIFD